MAKKDKKDRHDEGSGGRAATAKGAKGKGTSAKAGKVAGTKPGRRPAPRTVVTPRPRPLEEAASLPGPIDAATPVAVGADPTTGPGSFAPVAVDPITSDPISSDPISSDPAGVDTDTPVATRAATDAPAAGSPTPHPSTELARVTPDASAWRPDDVAGALLAPLRVVREVLPRQRTTVALGVAALALVGAVDLPVAIGIGLGWEALRRWGPDHAPRPRP